MIEAAAACVRHSAAKRPRMGQVTTLDSFHILFLLRRKPDSLLFLICLQVVRALDSLDDDISDLSNGVKPGQSEVYDSAQQSAQIRMFRRMAFGSQEYSTDFFERTHSSWGSRDHRDQTTQSQSSFVSRDNNNNNNRYQTQSSWSTREQGNQNTTRTPNNALAGFWDD